MAGSSWWASRLIRLGVVVGAACALAAGLRLLPQPRRTEQVVGDEAPTTRPASAEPAALAATMQKLRPLHRPLGRPGPNDWLAHHPEPGQTFRQYLAAQPTLPTAERRVLYVQPLGAFSESQRKVVTAGAEFMGVYFSLPVKVSEGLPLDLVPDKARRVHPTWHVPQVLSTYVLDQVLGPRLPEDAFAMIALTTSDLWPGEGWNFVFGQASLTERVGVWSIYRFGKTDGTEEEFRLALLRTIKTAAHETGHMLGMQHCTACECGMCGSNSLAESDRRPLALCPECLAKVCWATGTDPAVRYRRLAEFCRTNGLKEQADFYDKCLAALSPPGTTGTGP